MKSKLAYLRNAGALALLLIGLLSSCAIENPASLEGAAYPAGSHGYPLPPSSTPYPPTETKEPGYPYPPTRTPFTYIAPECEEDYLNGATLTPTPSDRFTWVPSLTYEEVGDAAPEKIVELLLNKLFEQHTGSGDKFWSLKDYEINKITILKKFDCRGPNQLENYFGSLSYSVQPVDNYYSQWLAGGAFESGDGWITSGTHFVLVKTTSTYYLKLTGNG